MKDLLVLEKLDVGYGKEIINNIDLKVHTGSVNAFLSSNNCGKTTLIKTIAGINKKIDGEIFFEGKRLTPRTFKKYIANVGYVPEDYYEFNLCDKVIDELRYPLLHLNYGFVSIDRTVSRIATFLEINNILEADINTLSMFDRLKVSIGSAIIHSPKILLLDDVFRELSDKERKEVHKIIKALSDSFNIAVIFTTSDINDVINLDNIYVIGDKKIFIKGVFEDIIKDDNDLAKLGIDIPIMIDLSRKLEFYNLVDTIYYDIDEVVDSLWK